MYIEILYTSIKLKWRVLCFKFKTISLNKYIVSLYEKWYRVWSCPWNYYSESHHKLSVCIQCVRVLYVLQILPFENLEFNNKTKHRITFHSSQSTNRQNTNFNKTNFIQIQQQRMHTKIVDRFIYCWTPSLTRAVAELKHIHEMFF